VLLIDTCLDKEGRVIITQIFVYFKPDAITIQTSCVQDVKIMQEVKGHGGCILGALSKLILNS